jgi:hypothetical protein
MPMADVVVQARVTSSTPPAGAVTGLIGIAGIVERPLKDGSLIKVNNFDDAKKKLGSYMIESTVMYGLEKLFKKLGKAEVYIAPVTHRTDVTDETTETGKTSTATISDTGALNDIVDVEAKIYGKVGDKYAVVISNVDATEFTYDVEIVYNNVVQGQKIVGVTNTTFLDRVSHADLEFTVLVNDDSLVPEAKTYQLSGGVNAHDGVAVADYDTALQKLAKKPLDFILVDSTNITNIQTAVALGEQIKAEAFVNTPLGTTDEEAVTFRANFSSKGGQLFHPHQFENDPLGNSNKPNRAIPIAYEEVANYILAHKEVGRRQVGAGVIYGGLTGLGLTHQTDGGILADTGVNYATTFENEGTFVWDAMTLSNDPNWGDANRVHLFNYIYKTLTPSLRPDLFKASDQELWQAVRTRLGIPMKNLFKSGELYSDDGSEQGAFFVVCDETNNPREEQLAKRMHVKVGYKDKQMVKWIVLEIEVA